MAKRIRRMTGSGKSLKLGLIGCERVAETRHLPALQSLPDILGNDRLDRWDVGHLEPLGLGLLL
jgi:hypothetical protein